MKFQPTVTGAFIALISVVSSSLQQISVRRLQVKLNVTAMELLRATAPLQAVLLICIGPSIDKLLFGSSLFVYQWSSPAVFALSFSCLFAVWVNASQYMCLGKFSAVTFQVSNCAENISFLLTVAVVIRDLLFLCFLNSFLMENRKIQDI